MAVAKTKPTAEDVDAFVEGIADEGRREDCRALLALMRKVTKAEPKMWGAGIVGFGSYHYRYESGHEGDSCILGFAPRKQALTIYVSTGFDPLADLLARLGPHKLGKGCLYLKRLGDVHLPTLTALLKKAVSTLPKSATSGSVRG